MEFLLLPLSRCQTEKVGFSYKSKQMQTVVTHEQRLMCEEFLSGVYSAPIKSHFINSIRFLDRRKLINFFPPLSRPRWQYGAVLGRPTQEAVGTEFYGFLEMVKGFMWYN